MSTAQRWLAAIPMQYREGIGFWDRDNGVLCLGMRRIGVDARFVALGEPCVREDVPLILGTVSQFRDPQWWAQWGARGVVLNTWGAPRMRSIARAVKASGAKVAIRMDTDGFKSPRTHPLTYFRNLYAIARDQGKRLPLLSSLARTILFRAVPQAYDRGFCEHLGYGDIILVESPIAKQILARYLVGVGRRNLLQRLRLVSHVVKDQADYDPRVSKERRVVCVARWNAYQKDTPRLMRVLECTLAQNSDYSVSVIGSTTPGLVTWQARLPSEIKNRVQVLGPVPHEQLREHYQRAQIILFTSRYEGFPLAGAEALILGCSVVGPGTLPALNYMASESSGTSAMSRRTGDLCDALGAEMDMWRTGARDPVRISQVWTPRVAASSVAAQILSFFPQT